MSVAPDFTSFLALDRSWITDARCRRERKPTEFFFPVRGDVETVAAIKEYCRECPVRTKCLDYGMRMRENEGWWGGFHRDARLRLVKLFKIPPRQRVVVHGTTTGYNHGCRDKCCLEAHRIAEQNRLERHHAS